MTAPDLLTAALEYHARGWPVVPVDAEKAACATFKQWKRRPQTEEEAGGFPWARLHGLAVLTWPASDLVVLDFDGPHAEQVWREHAGIALPETATNHSGGGWTHRIYTVPPGTPHPGATNHQDPKRKVRLVREAEPCGEYRDKRTGEVKPCGVDLLVNGYFIVPPTPGYREDPDHPFEPGNIATIPQAVLSLARRREGNQTQRTTEATGGDWFTAAMRGPIPEGQRNDTASRLAGRLLAKGLTGEQTEAILTPWARAVCVPTMDLRELRGVVESIARSERSKPKGEPEETPEVVRLADVTPEPVRWLWPGRIPRGKLTLIIGDPDRGKSCVTLDGAARVSRGTPWPDGTPAPHGDVILLTAEDGLADTVRPRLDAMSGDPARVHVLTAIRTGDRERGIDLSLDLPHLEAALKETGASLVVIDPVSAYLGKTDSWRDAEVRGVLAPVAALAERTGVAVVGIMHLTKDRQRQALYRAQGNISFVAAARAVFAVAEDPENPERRLFLPVKLNIARKPPGLAFRLVEAGHAVRVEWEAGAVDVDVETALAGPEPTAERSARDEAKDFLRELLADGPVEADEANQQAREAGISERTLDRAKKTLGVKVDKSGFRGPWLWSLPPKGAKDATPAYIGNGGTLGTLGEPEAPAEVQL
jgi:hypothetical protein